jgi:hypothetical protein
LPLKAIEYGMSVLFTRRSILELVSKAALALEPYISAMSQIANVDPEIGILGLLEEII